MNRTYLQSLALIIIALSALRCTKEAAPVAVNQPAANPIPASSSATATPSLSLPKGGDLASTSGINRLTHLPTGPDARTNLKLLIPEMIRMLEAKDYAGFLKAAMPPVGNASMPAELNPDVLVSMASQQPGFAEQMAQRLQALRAAKDFTPNLDAGGNKATYRLSPPIGDLTELIFEKEDGLWYPAN